MAGRILIPVVRTPFTNTLIGIWLPSTAVVGILACHAGEATADLTRLKLDELTHLDITIASRKSESWFTTPAAVYVVTGEEIQRSGVTSLADALRMVPGMDVARQSSTAWAVSSRGFNDTVANKLLVLVDGRAVYSPLTSGVYWDEQDTVLEDVDRIEVIRGPGATVWGANAVNGVVNVITKSAKQTQGWLVSAGGGNFETAFGEVRYGGKLGDNAYFRLFGKAFARDSSVMANGSDGVENWHSGRGGLRIDWDVTDRDALTLQGEGYDVRETGEYSISSLTPPGTTTETHKIDFRGGNVLGRWRHTFSDESDLTVQSFYDGVDHVQPILRDGYDQFDLDAQHHFHLGERQDVVWGLEYRLTALKREGTFTYGWDPANRTLHLFGGFLQDEITLVPDRLRLTLGTKLEHNDFTEFEVQPGARLAWTPTERQTVWASVSRAMRTPFAAEQDGHVNGYVYVDPSSTPPVTNIVRFSGDRNFGSEELVAYELGFRTRPLDQLTFDVAAFYNVYSQLRSFQSLSPMMENGYQISPIVVRNDLSGETYGAEFSARWQATDWWRWDATYSYLRMQLHLAPGSNDTMNESAEEESPQHQVALRTSLDLSRHWGFDASLRYVDRLPAVNVPAYFALDLRLAWRPTPNWELAVVGQNLLDDRHPEFDTFSPGSPSSPAQIQRSIYAKITWRF